MRLPKSFQISLVLSFITLNTEASPTLKRDDAVPASNVTVGNTRDLFLRKILDNSPVYANITGFPASNHNVPLKVGIIGAGVAGLYAAVLLESLDIDYEILEADTRIGGRIYTHRFDEEKWAKSKPGEPDYYNYYDAGAMRFPGMAWMDRVIGTQNYSIVSYINSKVQSAVDKVTLIPYYFQADNTFRLYNDKLKYNQDKASAEAFGILISEGGTIPNTTFSTLSPADVLADAISDLVEALTKDFDTGFSKLMEYDAISVRQYLLERKFTSQEIDWIESIADATEHYDTMSLSQAALEEWIFNEAPPSSWRCVEGGMQRLINGLVKILRNPAVTSKRVTGLKPGPDGTVTVVINGSEERSYAHVINTAPLGVIQTMDMTALHLEYSKKVAIRKLKYDPAGKIGMTFKTRWWEHLPKPFKGGQSFTDLPLRRCVYPSYGINTPNAAGAMIASYTWGQDSARLGAFYHSPPSIDYVVSTTLRDLARVNNVTHQFLLDQFEGYHLWDWYGHEFSIGAFAQFSPAQFSTILPALLQPAYYGKLHFAGEALSSGHGWIIGAVNSAYRTVAEILAVEDMKSKLEQLIDTWGVIDEVDMGWYATG